MINEELTFKKFGYYSNTAKPKYNARVMANCEDCGTLREAPLVGYRPLCLSCSHKNFRGYNKILTREFLMENYVMNGKSLAEVSRQVGCDDSIVRRALISFDIHVRNYKEAWDIQTPGKSFERVQKIRTSGKQRPNTFEKKCLEYLDNLHPGEFTYTGDGALLINRHSADAYAKKLNTIVLFNGCYWHLKAKKLRITENNKRLIEKKEAEPFKRADYKVIFIWDDEIDKLLERGKNAKN